MRFHFKAVKNTHLELNSKRNYAAAGAAVFSITLLSLVRILLFCNYKKKRNNLIETTAAIQSVTYKGDTMENKVRS